MNLTNRNYLPIWADVFLKKNFVKIERWISIIVLVAWIFNYLDLFDLNFLIVLSLSTLAILYFAGAFSRPLPNESKPLIQFTNKALHYSWSISTIGLLFKIMHYPSSEVMMNVGLYSSVIAIILIVLVSYKNWNQKLSNAVIRTVIINALILFLPV